MASSGETPSPAQLARSIETYLADHPAAAMLEAGRVIFDLRTARYAVSESHGRCLLQLWNDEHNLVRTVVEVKERAQTLRIVTRRMGSARPQSLELVPTSDRRTPTTRETARHNYQRLLERALSRQFIGAKVSGLRSAMDLEHSFGPAYVRGHLLRGTAADAVIGVSEAESPAIIDGILTLGILWLDFCRQHGDGRRHFGGLKVIVPAGPAGRGSTFAGAELGLKGVMRTTAERIAWLNHTSASFELFTLDERSEELAAVDFRDTGNLESRLVHAFSAAAAIERCRGGIDRLLALVPEGARPRVELRARSVTEVALLLHGLEFGRVRLGASAHSFAREEEVTFGAGANETPINAENEDLCRDLCGRLFQTRYPGGPQTDPLFRMQPERWLESELRSGISNLFPGLRQDLLYSQVPALSSGDRGMLDLLTLDQDGRLAIIELKANEDLHLPLQALDYWIRVRALHADRRPAGDGSLNAFTRCGYFEGAEVSPLDPKLLLVAPGLRIHPSNETVLRYFSPAVEWELAALGEDWRREMKIIFRKRSSQPHA